MTNFRMRQDEFTNSSRSFLQLIKDFFKNLFIFLKKSCQVFELLFLGKLSFHSIFFRNRFHRSLPVCLFTERKIRVALPTMYSSGSKPQ